MPFEDEAIALLRSIDVSMKELVKASKLRQSRATGGQVANDRDLNGKHGDPLVKVMPRDWTGPTYKNRRFSECPPDLLDLVAEMLEYFARVADEKGEMTEGANPRPVSHYKRADAARARGWAQRIREGKHRPPIDPTSTAAPVPTSGDAWSGGNWSDAEPRW